MFGDMRRVRLLPREVEVGRDADPAELVGTRVSDLAWNPPVAADRSTSLLPWEHSLVTREAQTGVLLNLDQNDQSSVMAFATNSWEIVIVTLACPHAKIQSTLLRRAR